MEASQASDRAVVQSVLISEVADTDDVDDDDCSQMDAVGKILYADSCSFLNEMEFQFFRPKRWLIVKSLTPAICGKASEAQVSPISSSRNSLLRRSLSMLRRYQYT